MNYNNNSLENLKDLYTSLVTTKTDQFLSEETEVGEAYKPIGREQENRMYRRAGNLARQSLASKGEKKLTAAKKSARIVSAITRQKEKERFDQIGQSPSHNEEYVLYDVVHDYLISEGFASDTDSANEIILKIDDDLMIEIYERMMTAADKSKETKLKAKYDPSGMKASMVKQYGAEKGKQVYFATIRKQAMGEAFVDPEQGEAPSGRSPLQNVSDHPKASVRKKAVKAFKSQMGKEYGGTWKSRSKDPVSEAVYGGTPKEEPKDTRMVVTNADKKANTKAYQAYKAGSKLYKAADHMNEECGCEDKKEPKVKDETGGDIRMVKNKLRAMGLKMSYELEGEVIDEGKIPVTRQAGEFRYSGRTGEEKAERRARVLSNSPDPKKRRQANTIRSKIKTVADRDTAQASSAARQKLYRGQQLRANDLAKQLMSKEEVEYISERRKEDKVAGTPRKPRNKAFEIVAKSMGTGRMGVQPRGVKKDKGGPTPGPSITPAERVARIRAARQAAQDNMSSRFD